MSWTAKKSANACPLPYNIRAFGFRKWFRIQTTSWTILITFLRTSWYLSFKKGSRANTWADLLSIWAERDVPGDNVWAFVLQTPMPGISSLSLSNLTLRPPGYDLDSREQLPFLHHCVVQEELLANQGELLCRGSEDVLWLEPLRLGGGFNRYSLMSSKAFWHALSHSKGSPSFPLLDKDRHRKDIWERNRRIYARFGTLQFS